MVIRWYDQSVKGLTNGDAAFDSLTMVFIIAGTGRKVQLICCHKSVILTISWGI